MVLSLIVAEKFLVVGAIPTEQNIGVKVVATAFRGHESGLTFTSEIIIPTTIGSKELSLTIDEAQIISRLIKDATIIASPLVDSLKRDLGVI